jgi:hypothetical protein
MRRSRAWYLERTTREGNAGCAEGRDVFVAALLVPSSTSLSLACYFRFVADFRRPPRFDPLDFRLDGTFAPFFLASDSPIAIACLRLFTFPPLPPLPLRSVPRFRRFMALSTRLPAALPYFRPLFFRVAMCPHPPP